MKSAWNLFFVVALALASCGTLSAAEGPTSNPWNKARVLRGALGNIETGETIGYCEIKCGKANRRGDASVSLKLVPLSGAKKSYCCRKVNIFHSASMEVEWAEKFRLVIERDDGFHGVSLAEQKNGFVSGVWSAPVGGTLSGMHYLSLPYWNVGYDEMSLTPPSGSKIDFLETLGVWRKYEGLVTTSPDVNLDAVPFHAGGTLWTFLHGDGNWQFRLRYVPATGLFSGTIRTVVAPFSGTSKATARYRVKTVPLAVSGIVVDGALYGTAKYKRFSTILSGY